MNKEWDEFILNVIENNYTKCQEIINKENFEINPYQNEDGENILHVMIMHNIDTNIIKLIIENSPIDINAKQKITGDTPMIMAAKLKRRDLFELIRENGGDIFEKNNLGNTAYEILKIEKEETDLEIKEIVQEIMQKEKKTAFECYDIIIGILYYGVTYELIKIGWKLLPEKEKAKKIYDLLQEKKERLIILKELYTNTQ